VAGFDAYVTSGVMVGSGLSSSAAFEILLGNILNHLCCEDKLDAMTLAQIGQRAENVYFGKPCGLLDQAACSVGGAVAIDFADPAAPVVERIDFDFEHCGSHLCIVDTGSCHADLTDDYAAIPGEMKSVAACFGKEVLREVDEGEFYAALPALRGRVGDRAVLRAMHFFQEDRRVTLQADALRRGDMEAFLQLVDQSGQSSFCNLQNVWSGSDSREQAVMLALARGRELLGGQGAIRVHGGGFAGTIQAFVPEAKLEQFRTGMEALLGRGMCHCLRIRPQGGCVVVA
jgi:galactokinase